MTPPPETLAELVKRLLPTRYDSLRDADRRSPVTYGTWQNITIRGTIPTFDTLEKVAEALGVPESVVLSAARASRAAREQPMKPPTVEEAKQPVSRRRQARGTPRDTGSTPPNLPAE